MGFGGFSGMVSKTKSNTAGANKIMPIKKLGGSYGKLGRKGFGQKFGRKV